MSQSGYDAFFKAAKQNAKKPNQKHQFKLDSTQEKKKKPLSDYSERELRKIFKLDESPAQSRVTPRVRKKSFSLWQVTVVTLALIISTVLILMPEEINRVISRIQFQMTTPATAQDAAKSTPAENPDQAKPAADESTDAGVAEPQAKSWSEQDLSYFSKLNERKQELDLREKELEELEQELNKQKAEVEARIQYLETVRRDIAGVLKDRVELDQEKVKKLVEFYSSMKPAQAAQIISSLNEDLAIGVLSNMKKKNAAEIMNLLEPAKAQSLSEKFAGYTKAD